MNYPWYPFNKQSSDNESITINTWVLTNGYGQVKTLEGLYHAKIKVKPPPNVIRMRQKWSVKVLAILHWLEETVLQLPVSVQHNSVSRDSSGSNSSVIICPSKVEIFGVHCSLSFRQVQWNCMLPTRVIRFGAMRAANSGIADSIKVISLA